jgi:hypothetical protein
MSHFSFTKTMKIHHMYRGHAFWISVALAKIMCLTDDPSHRCRWRHSLDGHLKSSSFRPWYARTRAQILSTGLSMRACHTLPSVTRAHLSPPHATSLMNRTINSIIDHHQLLSIAMIQCTTSTDSLKRQIVRP